MEEYLFVFGDGVIHGLKKKLDSYFYFCLINLETFNSLVALTTCVCTYTLTVFCLLNSIYIDIVQQ